MSQETDTYPLGGGLDLATPAIVKKKGRIIGGLNHEPRPEGYRRIDGFERLDGQPKPSEANYWVLNFDAGTATITEGQLVVGVTSGASGKALVDMVVSTGTFGGSNAAGYLVLTAVSGTFQDNEGLRVSVTQKCVANGTATIEGALTDANNTLWSRDAIDTARALIAAVPGQGVVRGAWMYNDVVYAFRDNIGATAARMYKATTAGWVECDLGRTVSFTSGGGAYSFVEGDTITGATSAATALIKRIIITSGTLAAGDAVGRLVLLSQSGTFVAENLNVGANLNVATIAANSVATTLPAGGHYEFRNHNFLGSSNTKRMYGVNGVGRAFEWDGTTFVPIVTGMTTDTPTHLEVHYNHLFLSFPNGSLQNSSIGNPIEWAVITGAGEIGLGQDVTGLLSGFLGIMVVLGRNKTATLDGTNVDEFSLSTFSEEVGAIEWTLQEIDQPMFFDNSGVRALLSVQQFGEFEATTLTRDVKPLLQAKDALGLTVTCSMRVTSKNQYRLFYSNGFGLVMDRSTGKSQFAPISYDDKVVFCASSMEDEDGNEVLLFGSSDGYVYQSDAGTSFDGEAVPAYIRLAFNNQDLPQWEKRYHKVTAEITAGDAAVLVVAAEFDYGDPDQPGAPEDNLVSSSRGGFFDETSWNEFLWSTAVEGLMEGYIDGLGRNISVVIGSDLTYEDPYTLHGITIHWSKRKLKR